MVRYRRPVSSDLRFKIPAASGDLGPLERWQHAGRMLEPIKHNLQGGVHARTIEESVLDVLHIKKAITSLQRHAALRLRADFLAAGMGAHLVASYNPAPLGFSISSAFRDRSEKQEEAYQRWRVAVKSVSGALIDVVVSTACCDEMPAPEHEAFLKVGLAKLVLHYGLSGLDEDVDEATAWQVGGGGDLAHRRLLH